ncbi:hypothetical protein MPSEU_000995300 [Mayamaea pseudoterrestris]|nr:hypothetical protein MPSEU_000995300 [Mayamaea pseudoterrestris]
MFRAITRLYHPRASGTYRPFSSMLDQFRDLVPRAQRMSDPVGRSWSVAELRRKSFQDLHKLWFVLYKERNMLLTEKQLSRRKGAIFPQPERFKKVQKSMGAIRHVLGERKRDKLSSLALGGMDRDADDTDNEKDIAV